MKKTMLFASAVAMAVAAAAPAAAATYNFTLTSTALAGAGTFTTTDTLVGGYYTVTGVTGTFTGTSIAGTATATALSTYFSADQKLSTTSPYFSIDGVSFTLNTGQNVNLYASSGADRFFITTTNGSTTSASGAIAVTLTPAAAVPEPAAWGMMLVGLGLAGVAARRRQTRVAVSYN